MTPKNRPIIGTRVCRACDDGLPKRCVLAAASTVLLWIAMYRTLQARK